MKTLIINSYPKTGSAILQYMLQNMYQSVKVVEKSNEIFDFSKLDEGNEGVICIVRNPIDTISESYSREKFRNNMYLNVEDNSNLEKPKNQELSDFLKDYIDFHKNLLDNKAKVAVLNYENLGLASYTPEAMKSRFNLDTEINITRKEAQDYIKKQYGARATLTEEEFEDLSNEIQKDSQYAQCLSVYNALKISAIN
jgi:hypothetical protein